MFDYYVYRDRLKKGVLYSLQAIQAVVEEAGGTWRRKGRWLEIFDEGGMVDFVPLPIEDDEESSDSRG